MGKGKYSISKAFNCKLSLIQEQLIASVLAMASLQRYYNAGQEKTTMLKARNKKHQANKPEKKQENLIGKFKLNEQADVHVLLNVH